MGTENGRNMQSKSFSFGKLLCLEGKWVMGAKASLPTALLHPAQGLGPTLVLLVSLMQRVSLGSACQ